MLCDIPLSSSVLIQVLQSEWLVILLLFEVCAFSDAWEKNWPILFFPLACPETIHVCDVVSNAADKRTLDISQHQLLRPLGEKPCFAYAHRRCGFLSASL